MELNKIENLEIIGINYKDKTKNAKIFLNELKNPYDLIILDKNGTISIEWGAYGVPETFLISDKKIIKKIIGPINMKIHFLKLKDLLNEILKFFFNYFILFNFNLVNAENENLKNEITKNLRCLICQGQSIYDSDSEFANSLKILVKQKLDDGYKEKKKFMIF